MKRSIQAGIEKCQIDEPDWDRAVLTNTLTALFADLDINLKDTILKCWRNARQSLITQPVNEWSGWVNCKPSDSLYKPKLSNGLAL